MVPLARLVITANQIREAGDASSRSLSLQSMRCILSLVWRWATPFVLGLSACATDGPSNVYRKPGGTQATYDKDIADCQRNATSRQNESRQDSINRCMMSKGWIVTRERT